MLKADIEDVKGCYESMMLADGSARGFSSTYIELVKAVQTMCTRLGIATTFITERTMKNSSKPIYTIGIKKTTKTCVSELKQRKLPPQAVWCPTTENHTWFMKQGSFVTLTSNCETSAVGRALGMCGIGIDTSVASAEEVANAIKNQETEDEPDVFEENATKEQCRRICDLAKQLWDTGAKEQLKVYMKPFGAEKTSELKTLDADKLIKQLEQL